MPSAIANPTRRQGLSRFVHSHLSEVWIRFLLALLGLVLAFAAAVFSTVSRESGDLWATLILASIALLLATLVGLTTVPYLARRIAFETVRETFDYDVTRAGIVYVLVAIVIGIAALNTGNNLLYIIVSAMLAAIFVSGIASALVLRSLELEIRLPEHVFAGRSVAGRFLLRNRGWLPSFSVSVIPPKQRAGRSRWGWEQTIFAFPAGRSPERQWFCLPDRALRKLEPAAPPPGIFERPVYFPYLGSRSEVSAELQLQFERRGRYQQERFGLATRFPFSFLVKTLWLPLSREIIVYPAVEPTDEFFEVLPLITGEFQSFVRGRGYDLYRIRDYMPEDSARHVDWKSTAKSGSPKVREFTREDERKLRLVFDNPARGSVSDERYEKAVRLAASLAWHFTAEEDTDATFCSQEYRGGSDLYQFLRFLALAEPAREPASIIDTLRPSDDYNVIITSRPHGTIPTALWACSYFVFLKD